MKSHDMLSAQESLLGYLYSAEENIERLIQHEERVLQTLRDELSDEGDSTSRAFQQSLASTWKKHVAQLRFTLSWLKKIISTEEGRIHFRLENRNPTNMGEESEERLEV